MNLLHEERFVDPSPGEVYAILLDEGRYLCSEATMYRLLRQVHGEVRDRRRQAVHPPRVKPELVADGPNQCWSWDIHLAGRAGEVDLLLPVLDHRHLLPLHRRLDARHPRVE